MKFSFLNSFLILSGITFSLCQKTIVHPSNYTRSYIKNIKEL